ncbi:MAG TPA: diacylglycerol kinase family protein [Thermoanaerobaculia bacterium]|nr:diacylglycerol kinase family protein [Thermoanaerobaculia bacterium]
MKSLFILNPHSGRARDRALLREVIEHGCSRGGVDAVVSLCERKEDLDGIIGTAERDGFDAVFAVGGDGTVHEIGKRLIGSPLALGIIPTGSGNGLARHLGISLDPAKAVAAIHGAATTMIDTGVAAGTPFLGLAGVGFDAEVAHRFGRHGRRGLETYIQEALLLIRRYEPARYRLFIDGETSEKRALLVAVANSSQYGNEARIAPAASLQDGLLDVCVVEEPPILAVPFLLRKLFAGTLGERDGVIIRRGKVVSIERDSAGPGHLDGEPVHFPARIDCSIRPASLRILIPRGSRAI